MKIIIATAAALVATTAFSQELKYGDLNYFFAPKEVNISTNINSQFNKQKFNSKVAGQSQNLTNRGYGADATLTVGFVENVNFFLNAGYLYNNDYELTGATAEYKQDGLTNPGAGVWFRMANQKQAAFNLDIGGLVRLGFQDQVDGDAAGGNAKDGTAANGRNSILLNARAGKKWDEANEWQVTGGFVYNLSGDHQEKDATGETTNWDDNSSFDLFTRVAYQYRPVNEFMIELAAQATRVGATESEFTRVKIDRETDAHLDFDFKFTAKYLILSNFIARFNYGQGRNPDYDVDLDGTKSEITNRRENYFGVGVDYLF